MTTTRAFGRPASMRLALAAVALLALAAPLPVRAEEPAAVPAATPASTAEAPTTAPSVRVVRAERREIAETLVVAGSLLAREEILVPAEIDGFAIVELLVEEGDRVTEGQVLARLMREPLETQLAQNDAQIARAEAAISQAESQIAEAEAMAEESRKALARTRTLRGSGFATGAKLDADAALAAVNRARVESANRARLLALSDKKLAEAQRREITWRLARTEIKAPRAGLVSRRTARLGAIAGMAGEPLFRIIAGGEIELEAEVADKDLPRIGQGLKVLVTPAGLPEGVSGTVRLVSREVDRVSRLGKVRVSLPADQRLFVGAFARGVIEIQRRQALSLPLAALTFERDGATVQVVTSEHKVETRPVTIGLVGEGEVEVVSGLAAGEDVVERAGTFLRDGDLVTPVAAEHKEAQR